MVNATVIVSATLLLIGAAAAIFFYLKENNKSMDDTTLLEACVGALGDDDEACEYISNQGIEWDTGIPCHDGAGAPEWNYRDMIAEMEKDWADHANDPDGTVFEATNAAEYIKTTCTTEILPGRMLEAADYGLRGGAPARRMNWGPCSTDLDFLMGGADTAECSGAAAQINVGASCAYGQGTVNTWRGDRYWMYQGCLNHDVCLVKGGPGYPGDCGADCNDCWNNHGGYSGAGNSRGHKDCDRYLADAARKCAWEFGSCGKGCWGRRCKNSFWESNAIWALMGNPFYNPNDGWCGI